MSLILNDADIMTGVELIDKHHLKYFSIANNLLARIEDKEKNEHLFKELNAYVVYHFDTEEEFMDKFNYDKTPQHKEQHEFFKNKIKELSYLYLVTGSLDEKAKNKISSALIDWFVNHIQVVDRRLCNFILEHSRTDTGIVEKLRYKLHDFIFKHGDHGPTSSFPA